LPIDPQHLRVVEAVLFAAAEPQDEASLAERLPEGTDIAAILTTLVEHYAGRGIELIRVAGKWTFRTAPDLAPQLRIEREVTRKLTRAAVETLAIIAYHQPITRAEIEEIRGVSLSRGTLDTLLEAGWVRPGRRRETLGRPVTWVTTPAFLEHFGLNRLEDLPGIDELKAAGLLDARPAASVVEVVRYGEAAHQDEPSTEQDARPEPLDRDPDGESSC
jgi:segregation and condensation protein B